MSKKKTEDKGKLESRVADLENQLKRAVADYRNLETRVSQGRSELTNFVGAELIKKMLPVLDHLDTTLAGVRENQATVMSEQSESNGWVKGVEMAVKEFKQVLQSEGLDQIPADPADGGTSSVFDPALHEAVDTREGEDNKILEVVRVGYTLNDKVLRPAQVVVGRKEIDG